MAGLLDGTTIGDQIGLEMGAVHRGVQRYLRAAAQAVERGDGASLKPAERLLLHWFSLYIEQIRREQRGIAAGKAGRERAVYGPYLVGLDPAKVAVLAMHEIVGMCMASPRGVKLSKVTLAVGRAVNAEANLGTLKADKEAWQELRRTDRKRLRPTHINRVAHRRRTGERWPIAVQAHMGLQLIWLLIEIASCDDYDKDFVLAFHHETRRVNNRPMKVLRMDPRAFDRIADGHAARQHLRPRYQPMICPPLAWTEIGNGGYLRLKTTFVKNPSPGQRKALEAADLSEAFEGVNAIGATPWCINLRVLAVVKDLWKEGGGALGLPPADKLPLPPKPTGFDEDREVRKKWRREAASIHRTNAINASLRMEFLYKLQTAEEDAGRAAIFFPHQLDFRGRAYPIPLYLNHQGDDLCRGLLEFGEGKPLGERGLFWLKVHAANCYGIDKVSFRERVAWVDAHLDRLPRTGDDLLAQEFWTKAEKPWQFLAAWLELGRALAEPHPERHVSHLPVQVDGSCNGLQHYAALGRDRLGAEAVNLVPADAPADVYARVAEAVSRIVRRDADRGNAAAVLLEGAISRKTVKQPVMTSVYGVTMVGARQQVYARLKEAGIAKDQLYPTSVYLSKVVLDALADVCISARRVMDWLTACAREVVRVGGRVAWTTPLGLPVEQPYVNAKRWCVTTCLQELWLRRYDAEAPVAGRKQVNGFAPNFIHSLDATHLLMTAVRCHDEGLAFAGVHDSYWTHAADTDRLGVLLRESFMALHELPILTDLLKELRSRWPLAKFPEPPDRGDLDLRVIIDSAYFFA